MPFPDLVSQGFSALEDSASFKDAPISNAIRYESDGELVLSRKRFSGPGGRRIETRFTNLSQSDKALLDAFYVSKCGLSFSYQNPISLVTKQVVFEDGWQPAYSGAGATYLWDITTIKLRVV